MRKEVVMDQGLSHFCAGIYGALYRNLLRGLTANGALHRLLARI
jgi:hypothetical protein